MQGFEFWIPGILIGFAKNKKQESHPRSGVHGGFTCMVLFVEGRGRGYYPFIDVVEERGEHSFDPIAGYRSSIASDSNYGTIELSDLTYLTIRSAGLFSVLVYTSTTTAQSR